MAAFSIKKGFDIRLAGRPDLSVGEALDTPTVGVHPTEYHGLKQRLLVDEGDTVKRGTVLMEDKRDTRFKLRAPAAGTVTAITRGERRLVTGITIEVSQEDHAERFPAHAASALNNLSRDAIIAQLLDTGYLSLLRQRPFGRTACPDAEPKAIFVNAMNTGPFQADAGVVAADDPEAFQAGLNVVKKLTTGTVHLCIPPKASAVLKQAQDVSISTFSGPHPAGNTSVHISRLEPMKPTDIVWTVRATDLVLIGRLFLDGALPATRIVALGGPGVKPDACKHWRIRVGASLETLLAGRITEGECRIVAGDALSGSVQSRLGSMPFQHAALTVLQEDRDRRFLGWLGLGAKLRTFSRTYLSALYGNSRNWALGTNRNGGHRAMVLTGLYDRVMPLNIMVDYLIRAVLAQDTDEAIQLGILETVPEDFALCDFVCPCKTEIQEIMRQGLDAIEEEGL